MTGDFDLIQHVTAGMLTRYETLTYLTSMLYLISEVFSLRSSS